MCPQIIWWLIQINGVEPENPELDFGTTKAVGRYQRQALLFY